MSNSLRHSLGPLSRVTAGARRQRWPATGARWRLLAAVAVAVFGATSHAFAQPARDQRTWDPPVRIYEGGPVTFPRVAADPAGTPHVVWGEQSPDDGPYVIYYARLQDGQWSEAVDIAVANLWPLPSLVADGSGRLHLLWRGESGTLQYSYAEATAPISAHSWSTPVDCSDLETVLFGALAVEPDGALHVVYPIPDRGVYYSQSRDSGATWSRASVVDSGLGTRGYYNTRVAVDGRGRIHVVWDEYTLPAGWPPTGVYYARSVDGGKTWSSPVELASGGYDEPNIVAVGEGEVHVAWNGSAGIGGRYHSWSADGGETWRGTVLITPLGGEGTSGFPSLAVDSIRRLHVAVAERAVVCRSWDAGGWSSEERVLPSDGGIEDMDLAIGQGDRLHLVFWVNHLDVWYTTRLLDAPAMPDTTPSPTSAAPVVEAAPTLTSTTASGSTPVATYDARFVGGDMQLPNAAAPFTMGIIAAGVVVVGAATALLVRRRAR